MGDRYKLQLECAWEDCKKSSEVYYHESADYTDFQCPHCGGKNDVVMSFKSVKNEGLKKPNVCEVCRFSLLSSSQNWCDCRTYKC